MIPRNNRDSSLPDSWEYCTREAFHRKEFLQHFSVAFISPALLWPNSISHIKDKPLLVLCLSFFFFFSLCPLQDLNTL